MIDDNLTFVRAVEKAHDELGMTYVAIAAAVGMSDSNLWAIRTQGREQRATAGTKALLDQLYAAHGNSAVVVVGGFLRGSPNGRKWETTGFADQIMLDEIEDDLRAIVQTELENDTIGGVYEPDLRMASDLINPQFEPVNEDAETEMCMSSFTDVGLEAIDS